jgi:hypothetical protein
VSWLLQAAAADTLERVIGSSSSSSSSRSSRRAAAVRSSSGEGHPSHQHQHQHQYFYQPRGGGERVVCKGDGTDLSSCVLQVS